mgnify:CR=1 FL=1
MTAWRQSDFAHLCALDPGDSIVLREPRVYEREDGGHEVCQAQIVSQYIVKK